MIGLAVIVSLGCRPAPVQQAENSALAGLPGETKTWLKQKVQESRGDYERLSDWDKSQLDQLARGKGRTLFALAKQTDKK